MSKYTKVNINRENTTRIIAENFCSLNGLIFFSYTNIKIYGETFKKLYV